MQQRAFKNGVAVSPGAGAVDSILGGFATLVPPYTMGAGSWVSSVYLHDMSMMQWLQSCKICLV